MGINLGECIVSDMVFRGGFQKGNQILFAKKKHNLLCVIFGISKGEDHTWIRNFKKPEEYTHPKKKLLAFSFANFEMTRGSTGMANVSFLSNDKS